MTRVRASRFAWNLEETGRQYANAPLRAAFVERQRCSCSAPEGFCIAGSEKHIYKRTKKRRLDTTKRSKIAKVRGPLLQL